MHNAMSTTVELSLEFECPSCRVDELRGVLFWHIRRFRETTTLRKMLEKFCDRARKGSSEYRGADGALSGVLDEYSPTRKSAHEFGVHGWIGALGLALSSDTSKYTYQTPWKMDTKVTTLAVYLYCHGSESIFPPLLEMRRCPGLPPSCLCWNVSPSGKADEKASIADVWRVKPTSAIWIFGPFRTMPKRPGAYLVVAKQHLEKNKKARLRMAQCVAFSYIRLRVPIAHIGSVLISSYVHLRSKSGLPSALECIEPGIGKRIIKQCFVENPNAGARFTSNGTGRAPTKIMSNAARASGWDRSRRKTRCGLPCVALYFLDPGGLYILQLHCFNRLVPPAFKSPGKANRFPQSYTQRS
ncbi:hypothetical protein B0H14DRAFT_3139178 [Mycena olivaceomarginata]|nr:hypothetical protein B0H14DRAFT_3139178 [Mycena olivaceomarginata]